MSKSVTYLVLCSLLVRVLFFCYGIYQDAHFEVKYTDIDYFVFHDAAGYVFNGSSPFNRDTYRYTPLLSWILLPNFSFEWIHFGKVFFVLFDLITGIMIIKVLKGSCSSKKQLIFASIWLLNPMVVTISTRGNAESIICFLLMCSIYFLQGGQLILSGLVYGLSIHFKIYPIIYSLPIAVYIFLNNRNNHWFCKLLKIGVSTVAGALIPTYVMYEMYGQEFLQHAYLYHLIRTDHRHNFSVWNLVLLLESAGLKLPQVNLAKLAFVPQLLICGALPYLLLSSPTFETLLNVLYLQTYAFVTYNKVCTSQYFIWYMVLLPFYLVNSTLSWKQGLTCVFLWILSQAVWLSQAYLLEFKGQNVFFPRLFFGNIVFFTSNVYLLGVFISDVKKRGKTIAVKKNI